MLIITPSSKLLAFLMCRYLAGQNNMLSQILVVFYSYYAAISK